MKLSDFINKAGKALHDEYDRQCDEYDRVVSKDLSKMSDKDLYNNAMDEARRRNYLAARAYSDEYKSRKN